MGERSLVGLIQQNGNAIAEYIRILGSRGSSAELPERERLVASSLQELVSHAHSYEEGGRQNLDWIGSGVFSLVRQLDTSPYAISNILTFCARIFKERQIRDGIVPAGIAAEVLKFLADTPERDLSESELQEREFVSQGIPRYVLFEAAQDIKRSRDEVSRTIEAWQSELGRLEGRISGHEQQLKKYSEQYNFVGLTQAFSRLLSEKHRQARRLVYLLTSISVLVITPLILQLSIGHITSLPQVLYGTWEPETVGKLVSFIGYEIILLYLFRVVLQQYQSLKAQALQLDLRSALCAFIEGYIDFLENKKVGSIKDAMSRFEALTFSPVVPTESQVPNTLDGIDQLVSLVRQIKQ